MIFAHQTLSHIHATIVMIAIQHECFQEDKKIQKRKIVLSVASSNRKAKEWLFIFSATTNYN